MDIEIISEFVTFSRYLSVTKAAKELNLSTTTLSRHLTALSAEVGAPIFPMKAPSFA